MKDRLHYRWHASFLEKWSRVSDNEYLAALPMAAWLSLRFLDRCLTRDYPGASAALEQEALAALEFIQRLDESTEAAHLRNIVIAAREAWSIPEMGYAVLFAPVRAYSEYLQANARYDEALDALDTCARVFKGEAPKVEAEIQLRRGFFLKQLSRFEEAEAAYTRAEEIAGPGDVRSRLYSLVGRGTVYSLMDDLPRALRTLRQAVDQSMQAGDQRAAAAALHDLGCAHGKAGRHDLCATHALQAYDLYPDLDSRIRALSDAANSLAFLGWYRESQLAQEIVAVQASEQSVRTRAIIDLLACTVIRRDRFGFERWGREIPECQYGSLRYDNLCELFLNLAHGAEVFGHPAKQAHYYEAARAVRRDQSVPQSVFDLYEERRRIATAPQEVSGGDMKHAAAALREAVASLTELHREIVELAS